MIKLVVSDLDGTLIDEHLRISKLNKEAISKLEENHIDFAFASGRNQQSIKPIREKYGLYQEAILSNGALYMDTHNNILKEHVLTRDQVKRILKILIDEDMPYLFSTDHGFCTPMEPIEIRSYWIRCTKIHQGIDEKAYEKGGSQESSFVNLLTHIDLDKLLSSDIKILKVFTFHEDIFLCRRLSDQMMNLGDISPLASFAFNIEITDVKAQKGLILEEVIKSKGLTKEEVAVLGDGMNDLSLFEIFPYSFAMSNGAPLIKEKAYKVIDNTDHNGFSRAISIILDL